MANVAQFIRKPTTKFAVSPQFTSPQRQYLKFLKGYNQALYRKAMTAAVREVNDESRLNGVGDIDWGGIFNTITSTVKDAAPAILQLKQQRDLLKIQANRAKKNLPPISPENYAQYATPAVGYSAELPEGSLPATVIPYASGKPMSKWIMYGGIAVVILGVVYFMTKK